MKKILASVLILFFSIFLFSSHAAAAGCTATTTGNWSTGSNWSGCAGAGGIPASSDAVTINSGVTITLDTAPTVSSVTINGTLDTSSASSFALTTGSVTIASTGTLKANASTITLNGTSGTLFTLTAGGTFTAGTSTVTVTPDAAVTISSGTPTFFNLTLAPTITTARTYTLNGSAISVANNFTINPTAASAQALTVNLGGALTVTGTTLVKRTTSAQSSLNTTSASHFAFTTGLLDIETGATYAENSSVTTFTGNSGTILTDNGGTYSSGGSEIFNGNGDITLSGGSSTIHLNGVTLSPTLTANHTYTIGTGLTQTFGNFSVNPTASSAFGLTVNMSGALTTFGLSLTPTGSATATFDTTVSNYALNASNIAVNTTGSTFKAEGSTITLSRSTSGNVISITSGAAFNAGTSTIVMTGDGSPTITSGTVPFYNLTISPTITANRTYTFGSGTINIGNNFTINPSAASALSLTVVLDGTTNVTGTTLVEGSSSASGILNEYQGATNFTFTSGTTTTGTNGTINTSAPACSATTTGNWSTGGNWSNCTGTGGVPSTTDNVVINAGVTITLDTAPTIKSLTINGGLNTSGTSNFGLTASTIAIGATGTLTANASTITLSGTSGTFFTITNGGTFSAGTSTIVMSSDATMTITSGTVPFYNLTMSPTITGARTYTLGSGSLSISNNFTVNPTAASAQALTVSLGGATTVTGTTLVEGTTSATSLLTTSPGNNYAFSTGKLDVESGGTFTENTSVITFTGNSGTILTDNGTYSSGGSEIFNGNGDITLTAGASSLHLNGATLSPTLTANHTYTIGTGLTQIFGNLSVNPAASSAFGLTVNMSGAITVFSLALTPTGSATATFDTTASNYALTANNIAVNTAGSTFKANASTITLTRTTSGNALATVSGSSFNAGTSTVVMTGDGNPIITSSTIPFSFYNLTFSPTITANRTYTFGSTALTITNNLTINPSAASAVALTVKFGAAATITGNTIVEGTGSATSVLDTVSGSNFALTTGAMDIESAGSFLAENATITDGGNWTNHGTFTPGNSTVIFNSSTTAAVAGPTTFYNFSITPASAKEVDFSANPSDVIAVTNVFRVRGSSGNIVKLHSVSPGSQWTFYPTGLATADWVDVQDGACQTGSVNISAADYTNSGNNSSCWTSVGSVPSGTIYYVDSVSGNDNNSGISTSLAWQTLSKVNASNFNPGDEILFKKGETFYGSFTVNSSGTSGNPIVFGAYGTGANPIITGFTTISGWTNLGSNIWESTNAVSTLSNANVVMVNGVDTPMGRYPNTGYLTYQSFSGNTSITSSSLDSTVTDWTGATAVIRKNRWIIDQDPITSQSGGTVTYSGGSSYSGQAGNGFFIQNDIRTLDSQNEWYYNPSTNKLDIYSASTPTNVQISSVANLVSMTYKSYVTFQNISFTGANTSSLHILSSSNVAIQNTSIGNSYDGILSQNFGQSSANFTLNNSTVNDIHNDGVYLTSEFSNPVVTNNLITNVGMIPGAGGSGDWQYVGLFMQGNGATIQGNEVDNVGYIPIYFMGTTTTATQNLVNNFCSVKDDGGGIYAYGILSGGDVISYNTILNGVGANQGLSVTAPLTEAHGVYIDGTDSSGFSILNNTVANMGESGIYLHNATTSTVQNNTVYNSTAEGLLMKSDSGTPVTGLTVTNNIFFEKDNTQLAVKAITANNDVPSFGTLDNNYYIRPIDNNLLFTVYPATDAGSSNSYDFADWQAYSGFDAHSHTTPQTITDTSNLSFIYNSTGSSSVVNLGGNYIDSTGASYPGSITLAPYSSAALIKTAGGAVATGYTITGPLTGLINTASTNFTVTPNGLYTGTITVTPSGGGLTLPTVVTFANSQSPQTFTITPTAAGTVTLASANNGGLTDPSANTYTVTSPSSGGGGGGGGGGILYNSTSVVPLPVVPTVVPPSALPDGCTATTAFSATTGMSCATATTPVSVPADCTTLTAYSGSTGVACPNYVKNAVPAVTPPPDYVLPHFTLNLYFDVRSIQVQWLQQYLNTHGYPVAPSGVGSLNHETTLFGFATKAALTKFQKDNDIAANGYFGPLTRAFVAKHQ